MKSVLSLTELCLLKIFLSNISILDPRFKKYIQRLFWKGAQTLNVGVVEKTWVVAFKLDCITDTQSTKILGA